MDGVDRVDEVDRKGEGAVERLIPRHGGYRKLKSFQMARLVYDVTVRFCERYVSRFSRTHDQMVQAARSNPQNIAEGHTQESLKSYIYLAGISHGSNDPG